MQHSLTKKICFITLMIGLITQSLFSADGTQSAEAVPTPSPGASSGGAPTPGVPAPFRAGTGRPPLPPHYGPISAAAPSPEAPQGFLGGSLASTPGFPTPLGAPIYHGPGVLPNTSLTPTPEALPSGAPTPGALTPRIILAGQPSPGASQLSPLPGSLPALPESSCGGSGTNPRLPTFPGMQFSSQPCGPRRNPPVPGLTSCSPGAPSALSATGGLPNLGNSASSAATTADLGRRSVLPRFGPGVAASGGGRGAASSRCTGAGHGYSRLKRPRSITSSAGSCSDGSDGSDGDASSDGAGFDDSVPPGAAGLGVASGAAAGSGSGGCGVGDAKRRRVVGAGAGTSDDGNCADDDSCGIGVGDAAAAGPDAVMVTGRLSVMPTSAGASRLGTAGCCAGGLGLGSAGGRGVAPVFVPGHCAGAASGAIGGGRGVAPGRCAGGRGGGAPGRRCDNLLVLAARIAGASGGGRGGRCAAGPAAAIVPGRQPSLLQSLVDEHFKSADLDGSGRGLGSVGRTSGATGAGHDSCGIGVGDAAAGPAASGAGRGAHASAGGASGRGAVGVASGATGAGHDSCGIGVGAIGTAAAIVPGRPSVMPALFASVGDSRLGAAGPVASASCAGTAAPGRCAGGRGFGAAGRCAGGRGLGAVDSTSGATGAGHDSCGIGVEDAAAGPAATGDGSAGGRGGRGTPGGWRGVAPSATFDADAAFFDNVCIFSLAPEMLKIILRATPSWEFPTRKTFDPYLAKRTSNCFELNVLIPMVYASSRSLSFQMISDIVNSEGYTRELALRGKMLVFRFYIDKQNIITTCYRSILDVLYKRKEPEESNDLVAGNLIVGLTDDIPLIAGVFSSLCQVNSVGNPDGRFERARMLRRGIISAASAAGAVAPREPNPGADGGGDDDDGAPAS